jgi:DNA-binding NarL/FixJ family response regulator
MLTKTIHVAILDDQTLFRKTLKSYLSEQQACRVLADDSDISELIKKMRGLMIDVLLMDVGVRGLNGDETVRKFREQFPAVKIVVLSGCTDLDAIVALVESGINAYVSKAEEPEELIRAITAVFEERIYHNKFFTEALYSKNQNNFRLAGGSLAKSLSDREQRLLRMIWEEKTNKEIANELFLGVRSIEKMRQDMKEKIGIKSTIGLLKYAINRRIIGIVQ